MEQKDFLSYLTSYERMSELAKTCGYEEILMQAAAMMEADPRDLEYFPVMGQGIGGLKGMYQYALKDLQKHILHYDKLYERWEDNDSQIIFANLIGYRLLPAPSFLEQARRISEEQDFLRGRRYGFRPVGKTSAVRGNLSRLLPVSAV